MKKTDLANMQPAVAYVVVVMIYVLYWTFSVNVYYGYDYLAQRTEALAWLDYVR